MASQHRFQMEWSAEKFINEAQAIHTDVEFYIRQVLHRKPHPEQAYKSCQGILSYAKRLGKDRLIGACQRANEVGLYSYKAIENILKNGLDKQKEDEINIEMPTHSNIRGQEYYQ
jgi:hypothetical protein